MIKIGEIVDWLMEFCYPGQCAVCENSCEGKRVLCQGCEEKLNAMSKAAACLRCAMPLTEWAGPCPRCKGRGLYPFEKVIRLGVFNDPLKEVIHRMKYQRRWAMGEFLAEQLIEQERVKEVLAKAGRVVAVPLYWSRQIERGYNQSAVIAKKLAKANGIRIVRPVSRVRNTPTQTGIHSHAKRVENLKGAFALVKAKAIEGEHVVVVDDVMTTGATLQSVGRVLLEGKPASLNAIVVAIADPRRRDFQAI